MNCDVSGRMTRGVPGKERGPAISVHGFVLFAVLILVACAPGREGLVSPAQAAASESAEPLPGEITRVRVSSLDGSACPEAPVTFGQVFRPGDVAADERLVAVYRDNRLPTQVDVRATNADDSLRHAVITARVPCDVGAGGADVALVTVPADEGQSGKEAVSHNDLLASDFDGEFQLQMEDGKTWTANARSLVRETLANGRCTPEEVYCEIREKGPLMSEWVVGAPLRDADGNQHPHLAAYFDIRAYGPAPVRRARVDVVVENNWAYQDSPQNYRYVPHIRVGNRTVYSPGRIEHYRQARWHKAFWWGASPQRPLYAALDPDYLQSTPAVPRYQKIALSQSMMKKARQDCPPMENCGQTRTMGRGGAQSAIGPLPRWSAAFVIDPNYRMFRFMSANTDALGSYSIHYRSRPTGRIMSVQDHPCATRIWPARSERCAVPPHGDDRFPRCVKKGGCKLPLTPDMAHHPAPAYAAYLATGDWFYESEMTYWANWVVFWQNPEYRDYARGLVHRTQLRGQAWMLRTLGDAAYLLPDDAPKKKYFNKVVANNLEYYNEQYTNNPDANRLGAISNYHAIIYPLNGEKRVGIASWQQSFFTWAVGNLADQGFAGASDFRNWVSQFQVGQMTSPDYCWEMASTYKVRVRDTQESPLYTDFKQVYDGTFPDMAGLGCAQEVVNNGVRTFKLRRNFNYPPRTMVGYPDSSTGFVANFQIGLAAAANSNVPNAAKAWQTFSSRATPTDYRTSPQFAVVPTDDGRMSANDE